MNIACKPWTTTPSPRRILAIRLQAMGDVMIGLPYLQHLRNALPIEARLDLLTRNEMEDIPRALELFSKVYSIGGARRFRKQLLSTLLLLPRLVVQQYDVVIDLQNNLLSRIVRRALRPTAWSAFDRFSPRSAGERNRLTIEALGLGTAAMDTRLTMRTPWRAPAMLRRHGLNETGQFVVLNPAGAFPTRNWEVRKYVLFARRWLERWPDTTFLILGTSLIADKAILLTGELGANAVNLVGQTTPSEAFSLLQSVTLVLSEDSGLMHMAWVCGTPVLALFGSTRSDWSRPLGSHSAFFDSSDLTCGNCMQASCRRGDVFCLSRLSANEVFTRAVSLLQTHGARLPQAPPSRPEFNATSSVETFSGS
jgi:heptosyltransferase II